MPRWTTPRTATRKLRQRISRHRRLTLELLEARLPLATFTVNSIENTPDSGQVPGTCDTELSPDSNPPRPASGVCTLRAAIDSTNANPGLDTVRFAIPGTGVPTINLITQLQIGGPVILDATTQGAGTVELRSTSGVFLLLIGSDGSTIRGFTINDAPGGIGISSDNNTVVGNRFGTDPTGTVSLPITGTAIGVFGNNNTIGGTTPEDRNIISNSGIGVDVLSVGGLRSTGNEIRGNYIGTDITGMVAMGHSDTAVNLRFADGSTVEGNVIAASPIGVAVLGSTATGNDITGNMIGTDVTGMVSDPDGAPDNGDELGNGKGILINDAPGVMIVDNVIAGSNAVGVDFGYGIQIANTNAGGAMVKGNRIGVNTTGDSVLGNKSDGIYIEGASSITIGGAAEGDRNIISGNGGDGVTIFGTPAGPAMNNHVLGNYIGVDVTGELDFGNQFRGVHIDSTAMNNTVGGDTPAARNIISGNDSDGVIIALAGATANVVKGNYIGTDKDGVSDLGNGGSGVFILDASGNRIGESTGTNFIRNVISGNAEHGVKIQGDVASDNVIAGNLIGTDKDGTTELPNDQHGVYILDAPRNRIGDVFGGLPSNPNFPGNLIAAKQAGVRIEGTDATRNEVLGNLIGVDISGTKGWSRLAEVGVHLLDAPNNRVGVPNAASSTPGGNTISNNLRGIYLQGVAAPSGTGTLGGIVGGNFIGTDREGDLSASLGNRDEGVLIENSANSYVGGQLTGSPELPPNVIAGNGGDGVRVLGANAKGNTIQGNSIFANGLLGIDLNGDGLTANDLEDADVGPNELQNSPFVVPVARTDGSREILGTLTSQPNTRYRVELFASDAADESGFGEGQTRVGFIDNVTTNDEGSASFRFDATLVPDGQFATATASDPSGNTSEFSCATREAIATDGSVFGVTNTNDAGSGSLREAILEANGHEGLDTIVFCLSQSGAQTIAPDSPLPIIVDPVIIDGATQAGASCNTQLEGGLNPTLLVELSGFNAGSEAHGLHIADGGSTVRGLVINRFAGSGILLEDGSDNRIECNLIGTDPTGLTAQANLDGVTIQESSKNLIGGSDPEQWNVISGNQQSGVAISGEDSSGNRVRGNFIGISAAGSNAVPNATGVRIVDASNNNVGGSAQNVISGNLGDGVLITETSSAGGAQNNVVLNNRIGTNPEGTAAIPNLRGVRILDAASNRVGGSSPAFIGNLISGNQETGVIIAGIGASDNVVVGNLIGTDVTGKQKLANGLEGISLGSDAANNRIGGTFEGERNIISSNDGDGIRIGGVAQFPARDNLIVGNYIGIDVTGAAALPNGLATPQSAARSGIHIMGHATGNVVGGLADGERNVISGNTLHGVMIEGSHAKASTVIGNFIGTDQSGAAALGNSGSGILVLLSSLNVIGGGTVAARNIISANHQNGVLIEGSTAGNGLDARNNRVEGNYIGVGPSGTRAADGIDLGNRMNGVEIRTASDNTIGETVVLDATGQPQYGMSVGNVIADNEQYGVLITGVSASGVDSATLNTLEGNAIGTNSASALGLGNGSDGVRVEHASGNRIGSALIPSLIQNGNLIVGNTGSGVAISGAGTGNSVRLNSIHDNQRLGLDLVGSDRTAGDGVTANDFGDADSGPNGLLNFPIAITSYEDTTDPMMPKTIVIGFVEPGTTPLVDVYGLRTRVAAVREGPDPSGFGEGERYLGSALPDETGRFKLDLGGPLPADFPFLSATATEAGSTSEFSPVWGFIDAENDGNPDTDGDSLCDDWETRGIDFDGDGVIDLNLSALIDSKMNQHQADATVPDIFVEVDWMDCAVGGCAANHASHEPVAAGLTDVEDAFTDQGIRLHLMPDEALREITTIRFSDGSVKKAPDGTFNDLKVGNPENRCGTGVNDGHFGTMAERMAVKADGTSNCENILGARRLAFRYMIFGHDHAHLPGSSGIGELPGNDFMVTLGSWDGEDMRITSGLAAGMPADKYRQVIEAGTIMHEMGHTLNLKHGGIDHINCKPNYLSVMSYSFQFPTLDPARPLDYSDQKLADLDEESLNEATGINGPANRKVVFGRGFTGNLPALLPAANGSIDWDGDGNSMENDVEADVNMLRPKSACRQEATDFVDGFFELPNSTDSAIRGNKEFAEGTLVGFVVTMLSGAATGQHFTITENNNLIDIFFEDTAAVIAAGDDYVIHRPPDVLEGHDDWDQLIIPFRQTDNYEDGISISTPSDDVDMTVDDFVEAARSFDADADGFSNADDNCPAVVNPAQADTNGDGVADACSAGVRVFVSGDTLHYEGATSQVNHAALSPLTDTAVVTEATELILEAGDECIGGGLPSQSATCSLSNVARIDVTLDDGDDSLDLGRFDISVKIDAGPGNDTLRLTGAEQSLDLVTMANTDLQGIETLDIKGVGANSLRLNVEAVTNLSDTDEMTVLANLDDTVMVGSEWSLTGVAVEAGQFFRVLERGTTKLLLNGPADWQNPINRLDVNANDSVEAADVLVIFNELNRPRYRNSAGLLVDAASLQLFPNFYFDVNSDGFVVPLDALIIINFINGLFGVTEGENPSNSAAGQFDGTYLDQLQSAVRSESRPSVAPAVSRHEPTATIARGVFPTVPQAAPALRQSTRAEYIRSLDELLAELQADAWQDELLP